MKETLFTRIAAGEIPSYIFHQTERYMAFLTPFPNTKGVTVVAPKAYMPGYVFAIDEPAYLDFLAYVRRIAGILDRKLKVARTALVFEGTGVDHLHAKLYPLHGPKASQTGVWGDHVAFFKDYPGYVTTVEGPPADERELRDLCAYLRD